MEIRMKKTGQFFFIFVPFLIVLGIQYAATFFAMGISGMLEHTWNAYADITDYISVFDDLSNLWVTQSFSTVIMLIYSMCSIAFFGLWYYSRYGGDYLPKIRSVFHPVSILGILMLVPGMQYLSSYIINFVSMLFPHWLEAYEDLLESAGLDGAITVGMFLYSVILAPFCEELIFRGITLRQAKKCLPFWAANLIQAILFGVFHMNMIQGIYAFCLGLILGYICENGGNIYNAILFHMLFNLWGTIISQYIQMEDNTFSLIFWFIFGAVMTVGGIFIFRFGTKKLIVPETVSENQ